MSKRIYKSLILVIIDTRSDILVFNLEFILIFIYEIKSKRYIQEYFVLDFYINQNKIFKLIL